MKDDAKNIITEARHPTEEHPAKPITLTLEFYIHDFKVTAITNSTYYKPGEWMTIEVAQKCCDTPGWQVNIVDNTIVQTLLNFGIQTGLKALPPL